MTLEFKACHRYARTSHRKVRYVVDLIRGRSVNQALEDLRHDQHRASRFVEKVWVEPYPEGELEELAQSFASSLGSTITPEAARELARRSRGTPRTLRGFLRAARARAQARERPAIDLASVLEVMEVQGIDEEGLDRCERRILRFDTWSYNQGNEDLVVGTPDPASPVWQYSECHGHFHYLGFAVYELLNAEGVIASGHKQAFCLLDLTDPPPDSGPGRFDCAYQGISAGWADVYSRDLPCQWIDVTDVPPGAYTLRIALNPEHNLFERDYDNNLFETPVTIE